MHKENHRKPIELKEDSSCNCETFILCRVLPTLLFLLEQAVPDALPAGSSVCSGLQFLRSVMHQCGKAPAVNEVRGSACGVGLSSLPSSPHLSPLHSWFSFVLTEPFGTSVQKLKSQTSRY